jgi:perosamine synthetase
MIPLADCDISNLECSYVAEEMADGVISGTGHRVAEFEDHWKRITGRKYAIAVTNGTVALELALQALNLRKGDEVIVPALTFAAPAAAVRRMGGTVVFADVDEVSWTLDLDHVRQLINDRTVAIIAVNVLGHPCDFEQLFAIANQRGIWVIEDAAESHMAMYQGQYAGAFGDISTFSFHANKIITTGEGGMILTDSASLAEELRLLANHGMRQPYIHEVVGTNARMTNLTAAIGCAQMERWDEIMFSRRRLAQRYQEILKPPFFPRPCAEWADMSLWLQAVTVEEKDRDAVVQHLRSAGIDARAIWVALPDLPLYHQSGCNVAKQISATTFWLPTYNRMSYDDFEVIEKALKEWM